MFDSLPHPEAGAALRQLDDALDALAGLELDTHSDGEVLALWRELEQRKRREAPLDHAIISQLQSRHVAHTLGMKNLTRLGRQVLRAPAAEVSSRVKAAAALAPRRSFTGEVLAPIYPTVAAGQQAGTVSPPAARVIVELIEHLPDAVRADNDRRIEEFLVEQAATLDVDALRIIAQRLNATLDPDGTLKEAAQRHRERDLWISVRRDGSSSFGGTGTAEFTEWLRTVLDTTARPRPADDGDKDPRTPGQRRHDGLLEALKLVMRAEQLPHCAGITTTVVLTMTDTALATGHGTATTAHGTTIPARLATSWLGGDTRIIPVRLGPTRRVSEYGAARRLFTENQRLALIARDGGCAFPGCDTPPQWTEAHHVIEYRNGGETSLDNGVLLCDYHHDHHQQAGWTCTMRDGLPWWTPPTWIDSNQRPIRSNMHQPVPI